MNNKRDFTAHSKRHSGQKDYKCNQCESAFVTPQELKKHIKDKENGEHKPLPIAKDSGFIQERRPNLNPAPQISGGNSGGAIAAGVVSVLIVILLVTGNF